MLAVRQPTHRLIILALALAAGVAATGDAAHAQGRLEARYVATLAGLPIGRGNWVIEINENNYSAAASGVTTGLLRLFTSGQGTSAARGTLSGGLPTATIFATTIKTERKTDQVRMTVAAGTVKEISVDPPVDNDPERIPVTDAERRGILDPMTASLMRTPGNGEPLSSEACQRTLAIFDGRLRYNLQLAFKRMDSVKADKGYQGPVVVCAVYFAPIAGFIPSRAAIRYLVKLRDIEVWLAPIAGTRVLVPYRMEVPTPIGLGVMEASHFITAVQPARSSASNVKTQRQIRRDGGLDSGGQPVLRGD